MFVAGASGSYTVILNRTKTIILDGNAHEDDKDDSVIFFQAGKDGVIYAIRAGKVIGWVSAGMSDDKKADSSEKPLDNSPVCATIKSQGTNSDGGPGSGNFGHTGVPGHTGGSAPSPSAKGKNPRPVGFEHRKTAEWKLKKHGAGYEGLTVEQFEERACDLLEAACENGIDGYLTAEGSVARFDSATGDFAIGFPGNYVKSMFNLGYNRNGNFSLDRAKKNFEKLRNRDEVKEDKDEK